MGGKPVAEAAGQGAVDQDLKEIGRHGACRAKGKEPLIQAVSGCWDGSHFGGKSWLGDVAGSVLYCASPRRMGKAGVRAPR